MAEIFQISPTFYVDIFSIIIVGLLMTSLIVGVVKGFLKELLTFISIFVIIGACVFFAQPLAKLIRPTAIGNFIESYMNNIVSNKDAFLDTVITEENKDIILSQGLSVLKIPSILAQFLQVMFQPTLEANIGKSIAMCISDGLTMFALESIASIVIFLVASIIILILRRLCRRVNEIPVVGGFNRLFGLIFAFICMYLAIDAVLFASSYIIVHTEWGISQWLIKTMFLDQESINSVSKFIYEHSIVRLIVEKVH